MLLDRVQQRHRLQPVARGARAGLLGHAALVDRVLDARDDQLRAHLGDHLVAILDHLGEVVSGVDVHDREGQPARVEGLAGETQQDGRVLAAGEQEDAAAGLGGHLADDVDGLRLECAEV